MTVLTTSNSTCLAALLDIMCIDASVFPGNYRLNLSCLYELLSFTEFPDPFRHSFVVTECDLYVTVEPCVMCAAALKLVKIGKDRI